MKRKCFFAFLLALLLGGCNADLHGEENASCTFGVVLKTMDSEHWMEIRAGMAD